MRNLNHKRHEETQDGFDIASTGVTACALVQPGATVNRQREEHGQQRRERDGPTDAAAPGKEHGQKAFPDLGLNGWFECCHGWWPPLRRSAFSSSNLSSSKEPAEFNRLIALSAWDGCGREKTLWLGKHAWAPAVRIRKSTDRIRTALNPSASVGK
jgi:hypothetical protein